MGTSSKSGASDGTDDITRVQCLPIGNDNTTEMSICGNPARLSILDTYVITARPATHKYTGNTPMSSNNCRTIGRFILRKAIAVGVDAQVDTTPYARRCVGSHTVVLIHNDATTAFKERTAVWPIRLE